MSTSRHRHLSLLLAGALTAAVVPALAAPAVSAASPTELFFSEYIEGSSNNKALEIFNGTGGAVDLAAGGYNVQMFFNGSASAGLTINLTGTVANGDVFVVAHSSANAAILAQADQTNGAGWFNGDDAVVLRKGTTNLDVIGQIGFDPGTEWGSGLVSTADNTLRRQVDVCAGDPDGSNAFDPSVEWDGFATDTADGLGTHTASCGVEPGDAAPAVSGTSPADGATDVAVGSSITVTFTEPVTVTGDWFTLSCSVSGAIAATASGGPTSWTIDPTSDLPYGETCTLTIAAANVTDQDTDDPPDEMFADFTMSFTTAADVCVQPYTPIFAIQGSGPAAAITGTVTTEGVVVGDYEGPSPALRGFYLQDLTGDGDAATSDGIFVFNGNNDSVNLGDLVRVSGTAADFQDQTQISANTASITICDTGVSVTPTDVTFPRTEPGDLEPYEGMLVKLPQTMYVTEHFQLGRFGQVVVSSGGRLQQPTNVVLPGDPARELQAANNLNRIIIDDALNNQNPDPILFGREGAPLSAANPLRGGDTATGTIAVMTYTWAGNSASGNAYRVRPINALGGHVSFEPTNPRPTAVPDVGGTIQVGALNLLNYFNTFTGCTAGVGGVPTDCRGAENLTEFNRQWPKTVAALVAMDADVVGIVEIENDGYGPTSAIADLVDRLNAATAPGTWAFIDADAATGQANALGTDAIKVGVIYRPEAVTPVGTTAALNSVDFVTGGDTADRNRPALAQAFRDNETGGAFTAVVNHLKSKGSACDVAGINDGQGECNLVRLEAAELLAEWLESDPTGTGDPDVLIVGDLNSYAREDPIAFLEGAGYTNLIAQFAGPDAYSYVFDGQWGYLDHALGSASLTGQVTGVAEYHINADEPSVLDYNTNFKSAGQLASLYAPDEFRVSDHDPVIVGLTLTNAPPVIETFTATPSPVRVGVPVTAAATFTDDDLLDTHTATIDWGDGTTTPGVVVEADGTVSGTHAYTAAGIYPVTLTVMDEWGNEDSATAEVVVFDPNAGFVVGGGWYTSPAGSLVGTPSWKGKATFGLSVRYGSGMTVPTGNFDFNLAGAPFKAYATGFDWLVVSGDTARFAGTATVNGMDGYTFLVTVTDGGKKPDTIRVVIRDSGGALVYDGGTQTVKGQLTLQKTP